MYILSFYAFWRSFSTIQFHYKTTRQFFPNLQTQWLYSLKDMIFIDGQIKWYVCWYPINYTKSLKIREEKEIEFKKITILKK